MSVTYPPTRDWTSAIITGEVAKYRHRLAAIGAVRWDLVSAIASGQPTGPAAYLYEAFTEDERMDFIQAFVGNQYLDVTYEKGPSLNTHADPDYSEGEGDPIVVKPSRLDPECFDLKPGQAPAYPRRKA